MNLARIILFTQQMDKMTHYYGTLLGLPQITDEPGWREFTAGAATLALHSGVPSPGTKGPKIVFQSDDVPALRETLIARGAKFGKARQERPSASAMAETRTAIPSRSPADESFS